MNNEIKKQIEFCQEMMDRLHSDVLTFASAEDYLHFLKYAATNYGNKDHGFTVLNKKITTLRQELLNLSKLLNDAT